MKKQVILDSDDVKQIVANSFNVDTNKVGIYMYTDIEGHGVNECHVSKLNVTVEVPMVDQR